MRRVAILISGGGSNMVTLVRAIQSGEIPAQPACVLSNDPTAGGLNRARDLGVPAVAVDHKGFASRADFEAELHRTLLTHKADLICLAGFMRILTADFVRKWEGRMLNIHPSLLPKYKGLDTHARAIEAGDTEAGCSVHLVTPELDDGPVLGQARVPILSGDTPADLAARVLVEEHKLYPATLREFLSDG